ncbi:hypothetical protein [Pseudooctadecabacter jejudonensis]|nr:hypothetical protein [Pseudooctadecabacter jejudonensis]
MNKTLALIFAALAVMIGSFIWFVATWDRDAEEPITFIWPEKLPPEGRSAPHATLRHMATQPYASHTPAIHKPYGVS